MTITPTVSNTRDYWRAIAVAPDKKLVAGGIAVVNSDADFTLARYTANGLLDTTFGSRGKVRTHLDVNDPLTAVVVLQQECTLPSGSKLPAGTIYVGGYNGTIGKTHTTLLARYTQSGKLDTSFDSDGFVAAASDAKEAWGLTFWSRPIYDEDRNLFRTEPRLLQTGYGYGTTALLTTSSSSAIRLTGS